MATRYQSSSVDKRGAVHQQRRGVRWTSLSLVHPTGPTDDQGPFPSSWARANTSPRSEGSGSASRSFPQVGAMKACDGAPRPIWRNPFSAPHGYRETANLSWHPLRGATRAPSCSGGLRRPRGTERATASLSFPGCRHACMRVSGDRGGHAPCLSLASS
ncbi:hypothetical protein CKO23_09350 [Thiocystis violacea]|nr:hypothetical protein [Thiocystis violacea]